jgi:hypothetical protein
MSGHGYDYDAARMYERRAARRAAENTQRGSETGLGSIDSMSVHPTVLSAGTAKGVGDLLDMVRDGVGRPPHTTTLGPRGVDEIGAAGALDGAGALGTLSPVGGRWLPAPNLPVGILQLLPGQPEIAPGGTFPAGSAWQQVCVEGTWYGMFRPPPGSPGQVQTYRYDVPSGVGGTGSASSCPEGFSWDPFSGECIRTTFATVIDTHTGQNISVVDGQLDGIGPGPSAGTGTGHAHGVGACCGSCAASGGSCGGGQAVSGPQTETDNMYAGCAACAAKAAQLNGSPCTGCGRPHVVAGLGGDTSVPDPLHPQCVITFHCDNRGQHCTSTSSCGRNFMPAQMGVGAHAGMGATPAQIAASAATIKGYLNAADAMSAAHTSFLNDFTDAILQCQNAADTAVVAEQSLTSAPSASDVGTQDGVVTKIVSDCKNGDRTPNAGAFLDARTAAGNAYADFIKDSALPANQPAAPAPPAPPPGGGGGGGGNVTPPAPITPAPAPATAPTSYATEIIVGAAAIGAMAVAYMAYRRYSGKGGGTKRASQAKTRVPSGRTAHSARTRMATS